MQNSSPPLNNQDAFNRVWTHFVVQQYPLCVGDAGRCLYRFKDNGCAVGCLLPDDLAIKADGSRIGSIGSIVIDGSLYPLIQWLSNVDRSLLEVLQRAHDCCNSAFTNELQQRLTVIAYNFNLNVPEAYHYYAPPFATTV